MAAFTLNTIQKIEECLSTIIVVCAFVFIFVFDMISSLFWAGIVLLVKATKPIRNVINFIWIVSLTIKRGLKMKKKKHWMKKTGIILGTIGGLMHIFAPGPYASAVLLVAGGIEALGIGRNVDDVFDKKMRKR